MSIFAQLFGFLRDFFKTKTTAEVDAFTEILVGRGFRALSDTNKMAETVASRSFVHDSGFGATISDDVMVIYNEAGLMTLATSDTNKIVDYLEARGFSRKGQKE